MTLERFFPAAQDGDKPKKKKVKVTRAVDGHEIEEEIEVDDVGGPTWPARDALRLLDHDLPRVDGPAKVSGRARYTHDVRLPGMLYARLVLCPVPHAKVTVDVAPAKAIPGVVEARSVTDGEARYLGVPVAIVAAKTPELAEDGARAVVLKIEPLPWAVTYEQSLAANAPQVTSRGNVRVDKEEGDVQEVEAALKTCDVVVDAIYRVPVQHHSCLETHGVVVDYRGADDATAYVSTQAVYDCGGEFAGLLGAKNVTAVSEYMGGGFGGKFGAGLEGRYACELAKDLKVPIHLMLTRRDEFLMAGNRSGVVQSLKAGATKDGTLVAMIAAVDKLGGLGGGSHPGQPYIYEVGKSRLVLRRVHTNLDSNRAMRAPGHPQASFGMESMMDELAYEIGMDPVEFRKKNLSDDVHKRQLERAAQTIGWYDHDHRSAPDLGPGPVKVGIGFGLAHWGGGGGKGCKVTVQIDRDGAISATVGSQDLGTGTRTYVAAIVAEEFGLELADVAARIGRSSYGAANGSGGSTTTASLAPAVKDAAFKAREAFSAQLSKTLGCAPGDVAFEKGGVVDRKSQKKLSWKEACATLGTSGLSALGEWQPGLSASGAHGAQAAKVEVDVRTGRIRVLKMVAVQDCGLPMNRLGVKSQLNGGMIEALSYGLFEERVIDPELGMMLNANFEDYKLAGSLEMPEFEPIIDDEDTRGVIGVGEPAIIPGHSAIANAIFNACGVRLREMPLTCDKLLMGLVALQAPKKG